MTVVDLWETKGEVGGGAAEEMGEIREEEGRGEVYEMKLGVEKMVVVVFLRLKGRGFC